MAAVNADEMCRERYFPEGLVLDCRLLQDVQKDQVVTCRDVALPAGRLADRLRADQYRRFFGEEWLEDLVEAGPAPDPLVIRTRSPEVV